MLYPLNRYVTVKPLHREEEEDQSPVLVPDGYYEDTPSAYMMVEVVHPHKESKLKEGLHILVPRSSIETVELCDGKYYLVLESHVMAFIG